MFKGEGRLFGSGNGVVKYAHYKTQGVPERKGMRNKRSAHREKAKRLAMRERERAAEAVENTELDFGFND